MKKLFVFVIGVCAGYIGLKTAINVAFVHFFDARFPNANFGSFVTAMSGCEHISILFFGLAFVGGTIACGSFAGRKHTIVGVFAGLTAGALVGALAGTIYFYSVY
jgi:hypothetical protein